MHKFKFVNSKVNDFKNKENIIITEPFFICSIDNFLDEKLYKDLYDNFPPTDFFVSHNPDKGNKVALDVRSKLVTDYIENNAAWKSFTNSINSQESSNFFKKVFESYIPLRKNFKDKPWVTDVDFYNKVQERSLNNDVNHVRYSFEFGYMGNGSYIPPHTDSENKVISMIFYFADPDIDWSKYNCGTTFFKTDNIEHEYNSWESIHLEGNKLKEFYKSYKELHYSEFKANKFLMFFKNDKSWHEVKKIKLPLQLKRKAFIVNVFHE
jgi:hypothetical protein